MIVVTEGVVRRALAAGLAVLALVASAVVAFGVSQGWFVRYPGPLRADLDAESATSDARDTEPDAPESEPGVDADVEVPAVTATRDVTHPTLWLCGPAADDDVCLGDLDATVIRADGSREVDPFVPASDPGVDCFYLYPTVSQAPARNAPLAVTPAIVDVTRAQAARFGEVCRVVAPVYRQVTVQGLVSGGIRDRDARDLAFGDVVSAFNDHLATSGDRPFVLIGHSQGAMDLTRLVAERIEGDPEVRARMVSALLIGGEVTRPVDAEVGGSFATVPPCRAADDTGCVVAYNSFEEVPPVFAFFGRGGYGSEVVCVNPAAPAGGAAPLRPYLPAGDLPDVDTPFVTIEGAVTGECRRDGVAGWLQVDIDPALDLDLAAGRAAVGPAWGLHVGDVNLALGDLVELVRSQVAAHTGGGEGS